MQWNGFPQNGVSIAESGSGDKLILLPKPNAASSLDDAIYVWNHETGEANKVVEDISQLQ